MTALSRARHQIGTMRVIMSVSLRGIVGTRKPWEHGRLRGFCIFY
ncbi:hypothetical protein [Sphingopyxis bauzanensis]|nr:hypothetical protein [Sphingopyxis bauzanensis]